MWQSLIGRALRLFSPRHVESFDWLKCLDFQGETCQRPIGLLISLLTRASV